MTTVRLPTVNATQLNGLIMSGLGGGTGTLCKGGKALYGHGEWGRTGPCTGTASVDTQADTTKNYLRHCVDRSYKEKSNNE